MLLRSTLTRIACCLSYVVLFIAPSISADRSELYRKNQELLAKDYAPKDGELIAVRIAKRKLEADCSWLVRFIGLCRDPNRIEILGLLKSGERLTIDDVSTWGSTVVGVSPTIIDQAGSPVGYFHSVLELDYVPQSSRIRFVIHTVAQEGLIRIAGEAKCRKYASEGYPVLGVSHARFDAERRKMAFTLRSSCYHVELFGSGAKRTLNMLEGSFRYDATLKDRPNVELAQRLEVSFDARGETFHFDIVK